MHAIELEDAQATLSDVVDQASLGKTSIITRHGHPTAIILSVEEWQRLSKTPSFGRLLTEAQLNADDLPNRNGALRKTDL